MKILLIYPRNPLFKWNAPFKCESLSLPILASLTPSEYDIRIIDEERREINYEDDVDLVGISFMTHQAPRAYEIADKYREKGIKVVLGGIHASALPEEALNHADAICIGEAENIWMELLKDFKDNNLKKIYRGEFPTLQGLPYPRLDLLESDNPITSIYSSRGCPFHCDFCAVSEFFGKRYRVRPIEEIIEEIRFRKTERMESTGWVGEPKFFFSWLDDNICGNKAYSKRLFEKISGLNIEWGALTTLNTAKDDELLRLMKKSGCIYLSVGAESLDEKNLESVSKEFLKPSEYPEMIKRYRDLGIFLNMNFIFGFDNDNEDVFDRLLEFIVKNDIDNAAFYILTPFPGTSLYKKLLKENRIIDTNWARYTGEYVVFRPKNISPEKLLEGYHCINTEYNKLRKNADYYLFLRSLS